MAYILGGVIMYVGIAVFIAAFFGFIRINV